MNKKTLDDILDLVKGKRILVRVDFNVPIENGHVTDPTRIEASYPTIDAIINNGGRAILMSHLGRPKGPADSKYSLRPVYDDVLAHRYRDRIRFVNECVGPDVETKVNSLHDGDICLLENLRFHAEEEKNDASFAQILARLGDIYVNDAFGSAHRAHASTEGVTRYIETCVAGYLMQRELEFLGRLLTNPKRPLVALLGGAKVSGKLEVLTNLMKTVDTVLIGGGMAFTFLKAKGLQVGRSLVEDNLIETARRILADAVGNRSNLILPSDCVAAANFDNANGRKTLSVDSIPETLAGYDIGPQSVREFGQALNGAGTIFWNGPMGVFEKPPFDEGTKAIAQAVAEATDRGAISVVGGGDSVAAVHQAGVAHRISHMSTGGGASLEFLEGKTLPGVAALNDR